MFNLFKKRLEFYVVKTENDNLAQCCKTNTPLIDISRERLEKLLSVMKESNLGYSNCKIVKVREI